MNILLITTFCCVVVSVVICFCMLSTEHKLCRKKLKKVKQIKTEFQNVFNDMVGNFYTNSFTNFQNRVCFICYSHHWNCFVRHTFWFDLSLQSVNLICFIFCSLAKNLKSLWTNLRLDSKLGLSLRHNRLSLILFSIRCAVLFPTLQMSLIFPNKLNGVLCSLVLSKPPFSFKKSSKRWNKVQWGSLHESIPIMPLTSFCSTQNK